MAGDFAAVKADLVAQVLNTHPSTTTLIAAAMVRQLAALQPEILPFMELSGSFSTVANQATYTSAVAGFPKSLLRFDYLRYDLGSTDLPLLLVDLGTLRFYQEQPSQVYPRRVAWQEEKLQFAPAPAGIYSVKWDCTLDSKKDTTTGNLITATSTTDTNPWFTEGVVVFTHLVLADYFSNSPDQRPDLAQSNGAYAQSQLAQLRKAQAARKQMNTFAVVPNAFDSYVVQPSLRIQKLFPGAHG